MRIALVINATAGAGDRAPDLIRDKIAAAGLEAIAEIDPHAALPARIEAAAALPGIEALVVAGGDGTMACAAAVMAGRDTPLGIIPLGTMNLLAKDLAIPLDLDAAIATVAHGTSRRIDLGDVNGQVFITSSLIGMPARMAKHREAQRQRLDVRGILRFLGGLVRHVGRYPRVVVTATVDGEPRQWRLRLLAIVNNDFVERPGKIMIRDPLDGGQLTVYLLRELSLWRAVRLGAGFAMGDWHRLPGLERIVVTTFEIGSRQHALRVMNDGEVRLVDQPLRYAIRPEALAIIVPRQSA